MNVTTKLACIAATVAAAGLMSAPAQAGQPADLHCPDQTGKVETDGSASVPTDLPDGTRVCYKAGKGFAYTTVQNGMITSEIWNKNENGLLGVSYYVPGEPPSSGS